ncbi:fatty acyl-CoA reductase 2 [Trichonephila clavipes]|nr:fatty acyl-CoA reductase 2 [Trichonephila clavipes]
MVDAVGFPSYPRHALLKRDLGIWLAKEVFDKLKEDDEALLQLRSEIKPDFPNHYVFCKYISENLILEKCTDIPSVIIRPSLISSAWKGPLPGYVEVQSSMAQFSIGISKGFVKVVFANPEANLELIPVDIVANTHIVAAYSVSTGRYSSPFVVNCTSYGLPLQYSTLTPMYLKIFMKYPVPNAFRYSKHVWIVDNHIEKVFLSIFEHYIPAAVMDLMLVLKGKKPK